MDTSNHYIAFSYNYGADYHFVVSLAAEMEQRGVATWYLDDLEHPTNMTNQQHHGGDYDWQAKLDNWHATFVDHLIDANGMIVVLSDGARASLTTLGRGMWRERAAVDYIQKDNPLRVREVENPLRSPGEPIPKDLVNELISWGEIVLRLPQVSRSLIRDANAFNFPTGQTGPLQLPNRKSKPTEWYELVRRDLYDVQWHCRRCSLMSDPYIMGHENPSDSCPRCGYRGGVPDQEQTYQGGVILRCEAGGGSPPEPGARKKPMKICKTCELIARRNAGIAPLWDSIFRTPYWDVVHSYDTALPGWLVLVARRHLIAVDELTDAEATELGQLIRRVSVALKVVTGCVKTYVIQFAEKAEHPHVHFHIIPRMIDQPEERRATLVFSYLGVPEEERVSEERMNAIAAQVREILQTNG